MLEAGLLPDCAYEKHKPFLNTKYANFGHPDLEVCTSPDFQVQTSEDGRKATAIGTAADDDVTTSARLLTVLRPHVSINYCKTKPQPFSF